MRFPGLGWVLLLAAIGAAVWGTMRLLDKKDETSGAIVHSITTPIGAAARVQAESDVRQALIAAQVYFTENGSYAGLSAAALRRVGQSVPPTVQILPEGNSFCVMSTVRGTSVHTVGPTNEIEDGPC